MVQQGNKESTSQDIQNGLIFIPDISGFSKLVHSTDVMTGRQITCELLSAVIAKNTLQLNVAEVEGDAILFFRHGMAPSVWQLIAQYESMAQAFEVKRRELEKRFAMPLELSLKVIAHYGSMTSYRIGTFEKLYGEVVVEAHRLLKNSIDSGSYLLLTDVLLAQFPPLYYETLEEHSVRSNDLCEIYGSLRNICFTYFDYSKEKRKVA